MLDTTITSILDKSLVILEDYAHALGYRDAKHMASQISDSEWAKLITKIAIKATK